MGTALEVRVGVGIRVRLILADFWQNDKSRRKGREKRRKRREKKMKNVGILNFTGDLNMHLNLNLNFTWQLGF